MKTPPWSADFDQVLRSHCRLIDPASLIDPDAAFIMLGIDSIELLHLILDCEDFFTIEFSTDTLTGEFFATPRTFWSTLQKLLAERAES